MQKATTLGELKKAGYTGRSIKDELRDNLIAKIKKKENVFSGIVGYEDTVIPEIERAILSRHNMNLLGLRGQAKTRIARQLTELLEVWVAAKEIQVGITASRTGTSPTTTTATLTSLSSSLEHVEGLLSSSSTTGSGGLSTSLGLLLLLLLMLLLLALGALGDTLKRDSLEGKSGGYEMTA